MGSSSQGCSRGASCEDRSWCAPTSMHPQPPRAPARCSPPTPGVMDGLAQNGLGANPQSAACWAQLDQQQASWYFWINTNKSSFSSWQAVLSLPLPAPRLSSSPTGARGEGEEVNLGCRELDRQVLKYGQRFGWGKTLNYGLANPPTGPATSSSAVC